MAATKEQLNQELQRLEGQLTRARYHEQEEVDPSDKKAVSRARKQVITLERARSRAMDQLRKLGRRQARR